MTAATQIGAFKIHFYIDQTKLNLDLTKCPRFEVDSSPRKYDVCIYESDPFILIEETYADGDVVLIDQKLIDLYNVDIERYLIFLVDAKEENKTIETCLGLISLLRRVNFNKANTLHVIGGGIIQDIGSFVGAAYKRGVDWILYPTTLLSMCDSCIGGKTGINYDGIKNQLALFSSPKEVYICTEFITTLEDREIKSGLGEVLKLYSIGGNNLLNDYEALVSQGMPNSREAFKELISKSLSVKKAVIEYDEFEFNIRKSLNYGHTIGHALEALSNYNIPHGQAVVLGMILVNKVYDKNLKQLERLCLDLVDLEKLRKISLNGIKQFLLSDKKTVGTMATFVVLDKLGITNFYMKSIDDDLINRIVLEIEKIV